MLKSWLIEVIRNGGVLVGYSSAVQLVLCHWFPHTAVNVPLSLKTRKRPSRRSRAQRLVGRKRQALDNIGEAWGGGVSSSLHPMSCLDFQDAIIAKAIAISETVLDDIK